MRQLPFFLFLLSLPCLSFSQLPADTLQARSLQEQAAQLIATEKADLALAKLDSARTWWLRSIQYAPYLAGRLAAATDLQAKRQFDAVVQLLTEADRDALQGLGEGYPSLPDVCYALARSYYILSKPKEALAYLERSINHLNNLPSAEKQLLSKHYMLQGMSQYSLTDYDSAIESMEKALVLRKAELGPEHTDVASVLNNLGVFYDEIGLYGKALEAYEEGLKIRRKLFGEQDGRLVSLLLNMGGLYDSKGEYHRAVDAYHQALEILKNDQADENQERMADITHNLAISFRKMGALEEAFSYARQALLQYQKMASTKEEKVAGVYQTLSNIYSLQGDLQPAIEFQNRYLAFQKNTNGEDHPKTANAYTNLGLLLIKNGELKPALSLQQKAVAIFAKIPENTASLANAQLNYADALALQDRAEQADSLYRTAITLLQSQETGNAPLAAYGLNAWARLQQKGAQWERAISTVQQALTINHQNFSARNPEENPPVAGYLHFQYFLESLLLKGQLLVEMPQPQPKAGLHLFHLADELIRNKQQELSDNSDRIFLAGQSTQLTQLALSTCRNLFAETGQNDYLEQAFYFSERGKAQILQQSIAANEARYFAGLPDSLIEREEKLKSDVWYYQQALFTEKEPKKRDRFQHELFQIRESLQQLIEGLEKDYPLYYQLKYENPIPRIAALQYALPADHALVSYTTAGEKLYVLYLRKEKVQFYAVPIDDQFPMEVENFRQAIAFQVDDQLRSAAHLLSEKLFPFSLDPAIRQLVVVPDGLLSQIPFEALFLPGSSVQEGAEVKDWPFLIRNLRISYASSATLFYQSQTTTVQKAAPTYDLLAFAPVFDTNAAASAQSRDNNTRGVMIGNQYLGSLPATEDEVNNLVKIFQKHGRQAGAFTHTAASEARLKGPATGQTRYLHLATHGFIDPVHPNLSGLFLYPDTTEQEDHILRAGEIYNLHLQADLVVLSACETGLGSIANGEGLLGISRAFQYAGAQNLIVSLWKVQDRATAQLMEVFYQELLSGKNRSFSESLQVAKRSLLGQEDYPHPYYWAPFVLIGH